MMNYAARPALLQRDEASAQNAASARAWDIREELKKEYLNDSALSATSAFLRAKKEAGDFEILPPESQRMVLRLMTEYRATMSVSRAFARSMAQTMAHFAVDAAVISNPQG